MGRSPIFCFSIKGCAGAAPDDGEKSRVIENKSSPKKRRWSLRKKYVEHNAPRNTVISEHLHVFSENQHQDSSSDTFYSEKAPSDPENAYIVEQTSATLLFPIVSSEIQEELSSAVTIGVDDHVPEYLVIIIQTYIRKCLAKKELQKLKNVVKLQAVARGYLVRRQAAGTLRCIQAIVKFQALVRARRSVQLTGLLEKQSDMEQSKTSLSIRKSVSSAFGRQLLESTPKTKPIHISCDPLRPDSAWNWLERWMALISTSQQNLILNPNGQGKDMKADLSAYDVDVRLHFIHGHASSHSELTANSQVLNFDGNITSNSSKEVELLPSAFISDQFSTSLVQKSVDIENDDYQFQRGTTETSVCFSNHLQQTSNASLLFELDGNPCKTGFSESNFKNSGIKELNETSEIEGNSVNGSGKLMNPAFAALQAKFEELSSTPASNIHSDHPSLDVVTVSKTAYSIVNFPSNEVTAIRTVYSKMDSNLNKVDLNEKLNKPNPEGQVAASDYVSKFSISTDKPCVNTAVIPKIRTLDKTNLGVKSVADVSLKLKEIKTETEKDGAISVDSVEATQGQKQPADTTISSSQIQEEGTEEKNIYRRPQNESPRSYTDFIDSPTTPSRRKSLHVRPVKAENGISARKKSPQYEVKYSSISPKSDSGARSNGEHLWKGTKIAKRPSSSGSHRVNNVGHENSSSSSSLPSYMQLTESAKAKISTSFFHKPNIGLHHKDNYIKKRHSLPFGNEKQGSSPREQNLTSLTQQSLLKGNTISFHNSTERRWQI